MRSTSAIAIYIREVNDAKICTSPFFVDSSSPVSESAALSNVLDYDACIMELQSPYMKSAL